MPTVPAPEHLTVNHLLQAVKRLSPAELNEFMQRFEEWQKQNGMPPDEEASLIRATKERLLLADERRLNQLGRKSERGTLTPKELDEYQALAQKSEQLDVRRVEALVKLAQRRGRPARVVMKEIGWRSGTDEETALLACIKENTRLPAAEQRRFNRLRRKRRAETLTTQEETELQALWQRVEQMNVARLEALVQLAQRRGLSMRALMRQLGLSENRDVF